MISRLIILLTQIERCLCSVWLVKVVVPTMRNDERRQTRLSFNMGSKGTAKHDDVSPVADVLYRDAERLEHLLGGHEGETPSPEVPKHLDATETSMK